MAYIGPTPILVTSGGTGITVIPPHNIVIGSTSTVLDSITPSAIVGRPLTSSGSSSDPSFSSFIVLSTGTISGVPANPFDIVNKTYADSIASGFSFETPCVASSTVSLTTTYNNGAAGVGATLTNAGTQVPFVIDGVTPATNDRILIKNQASPSDNGIYTATDTGSVITNWVLTRATDYDTTAEIVPGSIVYVINGTTNGNTYWNQYDTVVTIGTDPIQFSIYGSSGNAFLQVANNLSDVASASTSRTNLGLTNIATQTITQYSVLTGDAGNGIISVAPGTAGVSLVSSGASAIPVFGTTLVVGGGTGVTSFSTPYGVVCSGTSNTGPLQNVAALGASGTVLTSNGAGALPTFQAAAAGITISPFGASPNSSGLTLTGTVLNMQPADAANPGGLSIVAQTFTGVKTLSSSPILSTLTGVLTGNGVSAVTATPLTQYNVLIGGVSNVPVSIPPSATIGVPLVSTGATSNPAFGTAVVAGGGTGIVSATSYALICGGTTSTNPLQSVAGVGSVGQVLTSNGAGALPTWQASSGGVVSVSGTANRITSTGGTTPVIDISAAYVGQTSITTLGTVGTGTWAATTISTTHGGTSAVSFTPYGPVLADSTGTGALTSIAPSATTGIALVSQGAASQPHFGTVVVAGGGTGSVSLTGLITGNGTSAMTASAITQHDVLVGGVSNAVTSVAPSATVGVPLVSAGASADPSFGTAVVAGGGTGNTSSTAYAVLCGGTTSTGAQQSIASVGTTGQVLTSNGAVALPTFQNVPSSGFTSIVVQTFTSTGTYTPTSGMKYCIAEVQAAGGGGTTFNSAPLGSGGGGAGGYARKSITAATIGASKAVTIGAAGTGGSGAGGAATAGATASLGSIMSATGGGAASNGNNAPGTGGVGSSGDFNITGGAGGYGVPSQSAGGTGGSSYFGAGGVGGSSSIAAGAGGNYGAGGGGSGNSAASGNGGPGIIIITEYI